MRYFKFFKRIVRSPEDEISGDSNAFYYDEKKKKWIFSGAISMDMFSSFGDNEYTEITEEEASNILGIKDLYLMKNCDVDGSELNI